MSSTDLSISKTSNGPTNCIYLLGMIGAAIYFVSTASGFWGVVLGLLKSLVWPALLVFEGFKSLGV